MGVLTRFTDLASRKNLSDFIEVPKVYPIGRLDKDSEGLLLLTDRGSLVAPLLAPGSKNKVYLVCVEGIPSSDQLQSLRAGPVLKDGPTRPAKVERLKEEPHWLWERVPPIRFRKSIPTTWLRLTLTEGRNRQVRRMTASVGLPTLRLVRTGFASIVLDSALKLGSWREASESEKQAFLALEKRKQTTNSPKKMGTPRRQKRKKK